ncbi:GxxExxY protein [Flavobacteriaceae bacterium]|nr:GxxExxY protein [Flavobacteriaceae bacterium]
MANQTMYKNFADEVFQTLGVGYSERVYHNAMEVILRKNGIPYETERIVPIVFENHTIGNLRADLIVNNEIILELKAVKTINSLMKKQAENYLTLTGLTQALVINFPQSDNATECEVVEVTLPVEGEDHQ